jgi:O-antigen/teichoic acid export membrane protein
MNTKFQSLIKRMTHLPLMDQVMVSATNFLMSVVIIRLLGVDMFGVLTIMLLVVLFFQSIQNAYILSPLQTLYHQTDTRQHYAQHCFMTQCYLALICGAAAVGFLLLFRITSDISFSDNVIIATFFLVLSRQIQEFIRRYGFTIGKHMGVLVNDGIAYGLYIPVLLILHVMGVLTLESALWAFSILGMIACVHGISFLPRLSFSKDTYAVAKHHASYSKWLVGTSFLQWLSGDYFMLMTSTIMGVASVGVLRAVERIMAALNILILTIENIYPSKAAAAYEKDYKAGLWACMKRMYKREGLVIIFISAVLCLFAEQILSLTYGSEFAQHARLLQYFAIAYLCTFIRLPLHIILRTCHQTRPIFASFCVTALFSLATAGWLIKNYGLDGAVIGIVITRVLTVIWYVIAVWHSDKQGLILKGGAQ